ncbi:quaternary amine ABC transporter ATP-binding protein [Natranaerofaba carboxydovora]|uniref:quaternary amine ABC transporter ATP-binding protein n=1 Tax=Natranaerofaba carboxydovora TaxID=2742683 RepID=UPI002402724B|nr:glycine betaine/L-proline ABC transporter ATP-binding protein [Natranaerofaba carboxydovora]UMZ73868.1 Glycine betaine/carnitine transport ATP-binding protein GbuA [Natranaerofaba carboxydovora]
MKNLYKIFGPRPERAFPLLEKGVSKEEILEKTGNTVGVNNANIDINEGDVFVIMGLSGSGKSTLIRCINRLIEPTSGEIKIDGEDIVKKNNEELRQTRRKKLGMVFQHFALLPHKSVLDNVVFGLEIQNVDEKEREEAGMKALDQVGLKGWASAKPSGLSGGMQQRVGLARALALNPDVLLMDEPFSALDPLIRRDMQTELLELQSKLNKTILFITHDLDEALRIGDKIAIMKDGVIDQVGEPEEILSNPATDYVEEFVKDVNRLKVLNAGQVMKRPDVLIDINDGPRVALRTMEKHGFSNLFVVDRNKKLQGIIEDEDALSALKNNEKSLKGYLKTDFPTTTPITPLSDLIPTAAETNYPIAVVDEDDKLEGIIVRVSVLASLAEGSDLSD